LRTNSSYSTIDVTQKQNTRTIQTKPFDSQICANSQNMIVYVGRLDTHHFISISFSFVL
jgi:hypothetical protein